MNVIDEKTKVGVCLVCAALLLFIVGCGDDTPTLSEEKQNQYLK